MCDIGSQPSESMGTGSSRDKAEDVANGRQQQIIASLEKNQVDLFKSLVSNALPSNVYTRKKACPVANSKLS